MGRGVKNELTKSYVLSKISQELIFAKYFNIDVNIINHCIEFNTLIKSTIRNNDSDASLGFQYNNKHKLKARDFGGYFFGDCFDAVAYILSIYTGRTIRVNDKKDFYYILQHIAFTFKNIISGEEIDENNELLISNSLNQLRNSKAIIELVPRVFNSHDKDIWKKWGVSLGYLNTHFVIPVEQYYINRYCQPEPKYYHNDSDPCYAYILGLDRNGVYNIKLYFPLRDRKVKTKFITNTTCIEGILNLELDNYDVIVITKSSKDRLSLGSAINAMIPLRGNLPLSIGIVNVPSENYELKQNEYDYLKSKINSDGYIISFMDFDTTGRACSRYLKQTYNIPYIFITNGEFKLPNYGSKDFSELYEKYSIETVNNFINETIRWIE